MVNNLLATFHHFLSSWVMIFLNQCPEFDLDTARVRTRYVQGSAVPAGEPLGLGASV